MNIRPLLIYLLVIICLACNTVKRSSENTVDARINRVIWGVVSFNGKMLKPEDYPNGMPFISFDMQDGKLSGSNGCNSFMGLADYKGSSIKTGPVASTKMACPGNSIASDFYETLTSAHLTWRLDGETLRLLVNDAEVMALRERK